MSGQSLRQRCGGKVRRLRTAAAGRFMALARDASTGASLFMTKLNIPEAQLLDLLVVNHSLELPRQCRQCVFLSVS